jgi:hypothetical protein
MAGHPNDPIDLANAFERFATGRPAEGTPTGPMRRTGKSLWHVGWLLLLPESGEEQRGWGYVLWLLVLGGFFTILAVAGLFRIPPELDALRQWSLALLLLVQALLFLRRCTDVLGSCWACERRRTHRTCGW